MSQRDQVVVPNLQKLKQQFPAELPPEPVRVFVGKQRRGVPWGPFQIAPIYSQGVQYRLGCDLQPSQRSLGGKSLIAFVEGKSEIEMDQDIQRAQ